MKKICITFFVVTVAVLATQHAKAQDRPGWMDKIYVGGRYRRTWFF